jgi:hypothetical protein
LIAWLRTSLLIGSFAVALYNSTHLRSPVNYMAMVYAIISVIAVFYAGSIYQQRCRRISSKWPGHFGATGSSVGHEGCADVLLDELYGPAVLSVLLFAAVLANFIIRGAPSAIALLPPC